MNVQHIQHFGDEIINPYARATRTQRFDHGWRLPDALHGRIASLERTTANDGWDDEQGEPILATQWQEVRRILTLAAKQVPLAPPVFVSASGDGYAHLTWTKLNGDRAVLEIGREQWWWSLLPIDSKDDSTQQVHGRDDALARLVDFTG